MPTRNANRKAVQKKVAKKAAKKSTPKSKKAVAKLPAQYKSAAKIVKLPSVKEVIEQKNNFIKKFLRDKNGGNYQKILNGLIVYQKVYAKLDAMQYDHGNLKKITQVFGKLSQLERFLHLSIVKKDSNILFDAMYLMCNWMSQNK